MSTAKNDPDLSSNLEDYLEAISRLENESRVARAKDIASQLGVTRASVSGALKSLAEKGLINYEPYSYVTLTEAGRLIADEIDRRHRVLREFFRDFLKVDPVRADENACRVEHAMDTETVDRLVEFLAFLKKCPRTGSGWVEAFERFCHHGVDLARCHTCLDRLKATDLPGRGQKEDA
jgi:DtxR family Mn-dependent transcriptional regulator